MWIVGTNGKEIDTAVIDVWAAKASYTFGVEISLNYLSCALF